MAICKVQYAKLIHVTESGRHNRLLLFVVPRIRREQAEHPQNFTFTCVLFTHFPHFIPAASRPPAPSFSAPPTPSYPGNVSSCPAQTASYQAPPEPRQPPAPSYAAPSPAPSYAAPPAPVYNRFAGSSHSSAALQQRPASAAAGGDGGSLWGKRYDAGRADRQGERVYWTLTGLDISCQLSKDTEHVINKREVQDTAGVMRSIRCDCRDLCLITIV